MTAPALPIISKVSGGVLRFGGTAPEYLDGDEFGCDLKSMKITPNSDKDGEDVTLVCGTVIPAPRKTGFTINGGGIQRFDEPDRLQAYCYEHDGETVHFYMRFNDAGSPVYQGSVVIEALEEGGDAGADPGELAYEFDGIDRYSREAYTPAAQGDEQQSDAAQ